jgi:hypothetical protein
LKRNEPAEALLGINGKRQGKKEEAPQQREVRTPEPCPVEAALPRTLPSLVLVHAKKS